MANARRVYWDASIFIALLSDTHPQEKVRADIAEDILNHARDGKIEIWTSVWTIAEVIRPKPPVPNHFPQPAWAELLQAKDGKGDLRYPKAAAHFTHVWEYHERNTLSARPLSDDDARKIRAMFDWSWINKVDVVPTVAHRAAEIMRLHNMKAGDSIHVASALYRQCEALQRWDKDFTKTDHLIPSEEPTRMSKDIPRNGDLFTEENQG